MRISEIAGYPISDKLKDEFRDHMVRNFGDFAEGSTGHSDFEDWLYRLDKLHNEGGYIYRVVFVPKNEAVRRPLGKHWSMVDLRRQEDVVARLYRDHVAQFRLNGRDEPKIDGIDAHHLFDAIYIKAIVLPNNVTIEGVNLPEEYLEHEVNLLDVTKVKVISIVRKPVNPNWNY